MSTLQQTINALSALKTLANWHMNDAATALSEALDQRAESQARTERVGAQWKAISAAYAARTEPNRALSLVQVGMLSHQAQAVIGLRESAQAELLQADASVGQCRRTLEQQQLRLRSIEQARKQALRHQRLQDLSHQFAELDSLYLATRTHQDLRVESRS